MRSIPAKVRILRDVRPDVIYVNTVLQPLWMLLCRLLRIPVACHVHEAEASAARTVRIALALPLVLAHRLILNSHFSIRVLVETLPRVEARCVVVMNGVTGPSEVQAPRPTIDGAVRLLYVGRLSDRKGTADAIEAVKLLDDRGIEARLDIVGAVFPGYESVEDDLRRQVADAHLTEHVQFLGFRPDIWPWLADADILLVPSRTDEPFGNTAVEGVLAARPVIATPVGGLVEATEGYDSAVTVAPSAPAEFADAVGQIVSGWPQFRAAAEVDTRRAAARHAPAKYQSAIAQALEALTGSDEPDRAGTQQQAG